MFNHNPTVKPCRLDSQFVVYATAEIFGVAVSQGICAENVMLSCGGS